MSSGGALSGSGHQLTADREFRYIVQWFSEWSDFQREDFVPVLASYLSTTGTAKTSPPSAPYVNGIIGGMASLGQDKPMSLFQCRVKLFNEWSSKWPESHREKLVERLTELDADFGRQLQRELSGEAATAAQLSPGHTNNPDDPEEFGDPGSSLNDSYYQRQISSGTPSESHTSPEPTTVAPATIALVIAED